MSFACSMLIAATLTGLPVHPTSTAVLTLDAAPVSTLTSASNSPEPGQFNLRTVPTVPEAWMVDRRETRPLALPAMYATLGAMQAFDVYSTRRAVSRGANEANPLVRPTVGNSSIMLAAKALSTAGTIYFAERAWKKHRVGAVVLMAAINGVTGAIAIRNIRNGR